MKLLVISGSTRKGSFNTRLAQLVAVLRPSDEVEVVSNLAELPFYDGDTEVQGWPETVSGLREAVDAADGVVIVTPEYNGAVPGVLSNAVDWLSRPAGDSVLKNKVVQVLSASPGRYGGARAAGLLREVLGRIGAIVLESGLSVDSAHLKLKDETPDPVIVPALTAALEELAFAVSREVAA